MSSAVLKILWTTKWYQWPASIVGPAHAVVVAEQPSWQTSMTNRLAPRPSSLMSNATGGEPANGAPKSCWRTNQLRPLTTGKSDGIRTHQLSHLSSPGWRLCSPDRFPSSWPRGLPVGESQFIVAPERTWESATDRRSAYV